jgi:hypothetical protein
MARLIHTLAVMACVIVGIGFVTFAADELRHGSETQQAKLSKELNTPAPSAVEERKREREHGTVREAIDDANDVLLAPFSGIVDSGNNWVERGVPTLLALLAYGLVLLLIANSLPKPKAHSGDWRTA